MTIPKLPTVPKQPKAPKVIPVHKDRIGRPLAVGDFVAYPEHNSLEIGSITKLNNKMIKVKRLRAASRWDPGEKNKYPHDTVKMDGVDLTVYLLKFSG